MHIEQKIATQKILLLVGFFTLLSCIGFLFKLPPIFRSIDKEMHFLFYFFSSAFLNFLLVNGKVKKHLLVLVILGSFGYLIELLQEFSNTFFKKRIHGNFDIIDIKYNLIGLLLFSMLWFFYYVLARITKINNEI
jgi:VanZ family protein